MWSGLNDRCRMKPEVLAEKHGARGKHCATAVIMLESRTFKENVC